MIIKMKKIWKTESIGTISLYNFEGKLSDAIKLLKEFNPDSYPGYQNFTIDYYGDSGYANLEISADRVETDKEYEKRMKTRARQKELENITKKKKLEQEKKEYYRLRKKYG